MKGRSLSFLVLFSIPGAFAQQIFGFVKDKAQQPIEFANLSLLTIGDSSFVAGTLSDTSGYFFFEKVQPGKYWVAASQVGYLKQYSTEITVGENESPSTFQFLLEEDRVLLNEVLIQAQKPIILQEPGKMTVNIEQTVSSSGLMAMDLLKRMPGVQVDNNGNISLKGKAEVQFMIDGKPSYLSERQVAIILKSLPSNQISTIEIITSPSAKYDARGNAGIININLKKSDKKGINGSVQAAYGRGFLHKSNVGGSVALGWKKIQLNSMYDYTNNRNLEVGTQKRNFGGAASGNRYDQTLRYEVPVETHNYNVSVDYHPTSHLSIGLNQKGLYTEDLWTSNNLGTIKDSEGNYLQQITSYDHNPNFNSNFSLGGNGKYKIDTSGQEISVDAEVSKYNQRSWQNVYTIINENASTSIWDFHSRQPLDNFIWWAKADYTKALSKSLKYEGGIKSTQVNIQNVVEYTVVKTGNFDAPFPPNNTFHYKEQVNAAYSSLSWESEKWGLQIGLRGEHWNAQGDLATTSFIRDSLQLFPNLMTKYKLHKKHELSFAGSRRIDRPNYLMLNPSAYYSDPYSYYAGNPKTKPQLTFNTEMAHNFASGVAITTINYSTTSNFISDFAIYQTSDTSKIQYVGPVNIPKHENYGLSISLNFPFTKWWSSQIFLNVFHNKFEGKAIRYDINYEATSFTANSTQQFTFPNQWALELTGNYSSPTIHGYAQYRSMGMLSLGVKKDWLVGRLTTKINFQDMFYTFQYRGTVNIPEIDAQYSWSWDNRVVTISAAWKLEKKAKLLTEMKKN